MLNAKEEISSIIEKLPDDSSFDEILRELAFARMVDKGLGDSDNNKVISHSELKHRIKLWQQ